ncbi:peptidoglycan DD-metalloendopeptidase family protein [Cytophagales bacterium LB-30]|uniref:Peptidoglycan DD-metalloendopeptidase family protein n=2 Tax=Shiella aurantiaca TaxID=3058365 RepID=A0ABT8F2N5_9BACT|nr:peptidoglycan DD-metalloendopeptidase family protein [Shiella aurantiaca]
MTVGKCKILLLSIFLLGFLSMAWAQKSKSQLEQEKKQTLQKIKEAEKILNQTATQKKASLGQLSAINNQIQEQEKLVNTIKGEIGLLEGQIGEINSIVEAMEADLKRLREEYAAMIYAAQKSSSTLDKLNFIFSAPSVNHLLMRLKYLEQYAEARRNQVKQIERVRNALSQQRTVIEEKRVEKNTLLAQQLSESDKLLGMKQQQSALVKNLSQRETEIRKEITSRKKSVDNLEKVIAELVRKEIEKSIAEQKAREEAERKKAAASNAKKEAAKPTKSNEMALTPEAALVSSSFQNNKGKLPWPVASGFVSGKFGTHPHPVLKHVTVRNDGIDIQTNQNETVRAVFDGVVTRAGFLPGFNNFVIVKHGEYFTVYAKLKDVQVKTGQVLKAKDPIGVVFSDKDGLSEVQFQVWKNTEKVNPQTWLIAR